MKSKFKIIKKKIEYPCFVCNPKGGGKKNRKCSLCDGHGNFRDDIYYFIYEKNGKKYCIDSDTLA